MTTVERCRREVVQMAITESRLAKKHGWCEAEQPYAMKMAWLRLKQALKDAKPKRAKRAR